MKKFLSVLNDLICFLVVVAFLWFFASFLEINSQNKIPYRTPEYSPYNLILLINNLFDDTEEEVNICK